MVLGERADARRVFSIALREMVEIAGSYGAIARAAVGLGLTLPAVSLARTLTSLDRHLEHGTLRDASLATLARYGVELRVDGPAPPRRGPLLVVANHPGLFDALALFAAVARDDLAILAKRRELLDALPNVKRRLVTIEAGESGGLAVRGALRHLRRGGAVLHFPAGEIEPDPRLAAPGEPALGAWRPGLEAMTRLAARSCPEALLVPALVSGVISPRARRVAQDRWPLRRDRCARPAPPAHVARLSRRRRARSLRRCAPCRRVGRGGASDDPRAPRVARADARSLKAARRSEPISLICFPAVCRDVRHGTRRPGRRERGGGSESDAAGGAAWFL